MIKIGNLYLDTDFDYRIIREEENDIDLFIDINYRSVRYRLIKIMIYLASRIQFPFVRSIDIKNK